MSILSCGVLLSAYFLGSLPFGLLTSQFFNTQDPRGTGSKNIGATNVLRSGHKLAAFLTFLGDAAKGSLSVVIALKTLPSLAPLAGLIVVLGHLFPVWLRFRGGKGIATAFGVILVLNWPVALLTYITWIIFFVTTHVVSLASLAAIDGLPIYAFFFEDYALLKVGIIFAILFLWTHRTNISRLQKGREQKLDTSRTDQSP